ncbi:MAG: hypothetical protein WBD50_04145 [Candidatus Rhabdochlamydia sp.]
MSIKASDEFNSGVFSTFRRSFILKRGSQNRFSLMPKNKVTEKTESILTTGTFKRSSSNTTESFQPENWTQTLGRPRQFKGFPSALEQARKKFGDDGPINKTASKERHLENRKSFVETLKKNVNAFVINLRTPEEINACLQEAKKFFQSSKYKEAKNIFISLAELKQSEKKPGVYLYLAAIYLLENKGPKAKKYLTGITNSYLQLLMSNHAEHLSDLEKKETPFSKASFYEIESGSEDDKIVAKKLLEVFEVKAMQ